MLYSSSGCLLRTNKRTAAGPAAANFSVEAEPMHVYGLPHIVICDVGAEFTKLGYCGEESPVVHTHTRTDPDGVCAKLELLNVHEPMHLIVTENNIDKRELLVLLFERGVVESLLFVDSGVLDVFSYSRTNGVVVNYGGYTTVTSVVDGRVENKMRFEGGIHISALLAEDLGARDMDAVRLFKEEHLEIGGGEAVAKFRGRTYKMDRINKHAEELFVVSKAVKELIESSDSKSVLSNNIYMSGGGSKTAGLDRRMKEDLKGFRNKIVHESRFHTFFGASVLGSISQSRALFVCSQDYREHGEAILSRKSLCDPSTHAEGRASFSTRR